MNGLEAIDVSRSALILTLKISAPLLLTALLVGVAVSLLQALTQVQEFTLSFIPKILSLLLLLFLLLPFYGDLFSVFTQMLFDKITHPTSLPSLGLG
jgi:flagellar biosynthetic protein FliQ